jgi:myxalamid-type polyketide synthase MxaE and MxaD
VLSGDPAALETIREQLRRRYIFCRMGKVDFASHSPQMDPLRADLLQALVGLRPRPVSVPIYSTVTGAVSNGLEFEALYWARNLREPVLFSTAIQQLLEDEHDIFLEISPHPILLSAIQQGFHLRPRRPCPSCGVRKKNTVMLGSLGALYRWDIRGLEPGYPSGEKCIDSVLSVAAERCWLETAAGS